MKILWDEREVADALVAARGHPGGSVETVRGRVRLHLPRGLESTEVAVGETKPLFWTCSMHSRGNWQPRQEI